MRPLDPVAGSRPPWKSFSARIWTSTTRGASAAGVAGRAAQPSAPASTAAAKRRRITVPILTEQRRLSVLTGQDEPGGLFGRIADLDQVVAPRSLRRHLGEDQLHESEDDRQVIAQRVHIVSNQ